jgi:hypothetical protein
MGPAEQDDIAQRRRRAVRTAWLLAAVAFAVFAAFIWSGVKGS